MIESNRHLVEAIITLLEGYCQHKGNKRRQNDYKYLACQCIRQYASPPDHYHVSVAAQEFWDELTDEPIEKYFYRDVVPCNKLKEPITRTIYKGANKEGEKIELTPDGKFIFNDLFQCDHVVPVSHIFKKLKGTKEKDLTFEYVDSVLSEMHLCKITKDEDHKIGRTRCRFDTFEKTIAEGAYKEVPLVMDEYLRSIGYKR